MEESLGSRIRAARVAAALSQAQCARSAGLPDSRSLWRIESDKTVPSADVVKRLAAVIGVTTDALIVGDKPAVEPPPAGDDDDLEALEGPASRRRAVDRALGSVLPVLPSVPVERRRRDRRAARRA